MAKSQRSIEERISEKEVQYEQALEKVKQYQAQMKRLKQQQKAEERKKRTHLLRTHLLCQLGGVIEKVLARPLVDEDVMRLLNFLNQQEHNGKYFTKAMEKSPDTGKGLDGDTNE